MKFHVAETVSLESLKEKLATLLKYVDDTQKLIMFHPDQVWFRLVPDRGGAPIRRGEVPELDALLEQVAWINPQAGTDKVRKGLLKYEGCAFVFKDSPTVCYQYARGGDGCHYHFRHVGVMGKDERTDVIHPEEPAWSGHDVKWEITHVVRGIVTSDNTSREVKVAQLWGQTSEDW